MRFKNKTKFLINGLNQEKLLNEISKIATLTDVERHSKNETTFKCSYFDHKKVEKLLKIKNVKILKIEHEGLAFKLKTILTSYGILAAMLLSAIFYSIQYQFILRYEVVGLDKLSQNEVVEFVKDSYSRNKHKIDTSEIEIGLVDKFDEISFVSCMIKGQTLVINIKEKLMPEEMYGEFAPIVATKSGKISEIELISGTMLVKIGDFVQAGEILVAPYTIDTSGQLKKVEAKATIKAEVYNEGSVDHYSSFIQVERTGKTAQENDITLFGLTIYTFKDEMNFDLYEVEYEDVNLSKNLFLPFKMKKTIYYELSQQLVQSNFEDVQEEYIEKAKQKALENCGNCDTIIDEFYTLRHLSGVTIVNYCIVTLEEIGGQE